MAEAGRAQAASLRITVNAQYGCVPQHGEVNNSGDVYFDVAPANGCLIHTSPAQAFDGENADGYISLSNGPNGPFVPADQNVVITYCACAIGGTCDPFQSKLTGGNTIKVGNPPEPGHQK
jgi:hypothetical protein